jgi:hypothetical protein
MNAALGKITPLALFHLAGFQLIFAARPATLSLEKLKRVLGHPASATYPERIQPLFPVLSPLVVAA